jgi:hypothetical protein
VLERHACEVLEKLGTLWDGMANQKDAEIRLLSANNDVLRIQIHKLRCCLDDALDFWTENNEALRQQARDLHCCLDQLRNTFVSS